MQEITDEFMRQMLPAAKPYSIVILKAGPNRDSPGVEAIIWEHGRRNFALRADGILSIACPVADGSPLNGIGIFSTGVAETAAIMEKDPGVQAGVFTFEVHPSRSFPGDCLP